MKLLYAALAVLCFLAAAIYVAAEYFFSYAIKRAKKPPAEYTDILKKRLLGTEREYLLRDTELGKRFLAEHPCEQVSITSFDSLTLRGRLYTPEVGADTTVIFIHGYKSGPHVDFPVQIRRYYNLGYNALVIDHRAAGESEGKHYGFGVLERHDIEGWCRFVRERFGDEQKTVLFGCSMGSATALMAASLPFVRESVSAIVADCPFSSPYDEFCYIIKRDFHLPPFPLVPLTSRLTRRRAGWAFDEYSAAAAAATTDVPILLIHGTSDVYVPARFSLDIYESASKASCELMLVDGASHGYSVYQDPTRYFARADEFILRHTDAKIGRRAAEE